MIIDHLDKTISIKIVYYGPALSGKTTSLKSLFSHFGKKEELISIENTLGRTLFFDYGVVTFQDEEWFLKINIYTTTGQDFYIMTRPITLRAVDGIIFVIDSQKKVYERNLISWNELISYIQDAINNIPIIIAFNKQDLPCKFKSIEFLKRIDFQKYKRIDSLNTIAINGEGILKCFEEMLKMILKKYFDYKEISAIKYRL